MGLFLAVFASRYGCNYKCTHTFERRVGCGALARIIRIGNSRGIRLPKSILEQCELGATVELSVDQGVLVVRPVSAPRAGWDEAFRAMTDLGDDALLDPEAPVGTAWDEQDWEWPNQ